MAVKSNDAFVIICTITSSPRTPPVYTIPRQPVPRALLETVGALLDDPLYSDVKFIIPRRGQSISNGWTIWASKKLLQRAEYFQTSEFYICDATPSDCYSGIFQCLVLTLQKVLILHMTSTRRLEQRIETLNGVLLNLIYCLTSSKILITSLTMI